MSDVTWQALPRSERAEVNRHQCDVWRVCGGARFSVWSRMLKVYIAGGKLDTVEAAKESATNAALNPDDFDE